MEIATTVRRLKLTADHLDTVPAEEFNMRNWETCALGHAAQISEFKKLGFELARDLRFARHDARHTAKFESAYGLPAAEAFLGLSSWWVNRLFAPYGWFALSVDAITPAVVATGVRELITKLEAGNSR